MLTKILVTALVIAACYFYLRYQRNKQLPGGNSSANYSEKTSLSTQVQWVAGGLVSLTFCAAIGFFIYDWLDDRQILSVKITNPHNGEIVTYQVYKGDMEEQSFETLQGQLVRISNSERIEISEVIE